MFYNIILSKYKRDHVVDYVKKQKELNVNYTVVDIGGSEETIYWSREIIDYVIDFNDIKNKNIKQFNFNINYETQWNKVIQHVEENGKFDFCICSHTLEDLAMPSVTLKMMPLIAKEGFIATPSKFSELSRVLDQPWLGYIHHRWIYTFKDGVYTAIPKLNFIEFIPDLLKLGTSDSNFFDLSFFWKDNIEFKILNNDYLGPTANDVINYYNILLDDDLISINEKGKKLD